MKILINLFDQDKFISYYSKAKYEGKLDIEIAKTLNTNYATLRVLKDIYGLDAPRIRRNKLDVTEDDFRKGAEIGLDRRIILRRVRDGMSVKQAISTPRKKIRRSRNE